MKESRKKSTRRKTAVLHTPGRWIDIVFLSVFFAIGVASTWPMYQTPWFFLMAGVGFGCGTVYGWWALSRGQRWWHIGLAVIAFYLVLGVPIAYPDFFAAPGEFFTFFMRIVAAPITGWKDILTLDLPLGTYQATQAPFFLVALIVPILALALMWKSERFWPCAIPIALLPAFFGIVWGSSVVRGTLTVGGHIVTGLWPVAMGLVTIMTALVWMSWRIRSARRASLTTGAHLRGHRTVSHRRAHASSLVAGAVMLAAATVTGVVVTPLWLAHSVRDVPRTDIVPDIRITGELGPLVGYRNYFSNDAYNEEVFSVKSSQDRVRVAVMSFYDGTTAQIVDPVAANHLESTFRRVPSRVGVQGPTTDTSVTLGRYSDMWIPLAGDLSSIRFGGENKIALQDNFFYNDQTLTGVELAERDLPGLTYTFSSVPETGSTANISQFHPARESSAWAAAHPEAIPQSVDTWVKMQGVRPDGAGLVQLVTTLRARGFLSHGLLAPESGQPAQWMTDLGMGADQFQASRAGHSTARIDALFTAMVNRQYAHPRGDDAALVSAVGDDEQFAVAAAMIADHLGFNVRIVLGARLVADGTEDVPVCDAGACTGADMSVWIEVQDGTNGAWAPLDVTPQHAHAIQEETQKLSDPHNNTEVDPESADVVPPPDSNQGDGEKRPSSPTDDPGLVVHISNGLRVTGIALSAILLLLLPFFAVVVAKWFRRRSRRKADYPAIRVVGAWDEYLDVASDLGKSLSAEKTRSELVSLLAPESSGASHLAFAADRAVFSPEIVQPEEAKSAWALVHEETRALRKQESRRTRIRSVLSLRSFWREAKSIHDSARAEAQRKKESKRPKNTTVRIAKKTTIVPANTSRRR